MRKFKHLSEKERFVIEKLFVAGVKLREIARFLLRSPNTISREISKNTVAGKYLAEKAHRRAYFKRWRSKRQCLKVAIAFVNWREIESLLNTKVYFTHPYHSWEKGLVENTNRWIRCFVPKRRDIGSVSEEEISEILSFLNDRPRKVIGFRLPSVYNLENNLSYFGG